MHHPESPHNCIVDLNFVFYGFQLPNNFIIILIYIWSQLITSFFGRSQLIISSATFGVLGVYILR